MFLLKKKRTFGQVRRWCWVNVLMRITTVDHVIYESNSYYSLSCGCHFQRIACSALVVVNHDSSLITSTSSPAGRVLPNKIPVDVEKNASLKQKSNRMIIPIPNKNTNLTEGSSSIPVQKKSCVFFSTSLSIFSPWPWLLQLFWPRQRPPQPSNEITMGPWDGKIWWMTKPHKVVVFSCSVPDLFPTWNPDAGNRFTSTVSWILSDHSMIQQKWMSLHICRPKIEKVPQWKVHLILTSKSSEWWKRMENAMYPTTLEDRAVPTLSTMLKIWY